jgi:5-methylcytosine-specific restriction endonuclease McrA
MIRDRRTYIKLHDGMPDHPKVGTLSDKAFRLLVEAWCWCSRHSTSVVPAATQQAIAGRAWRRRVAELVAAGLFHESGHECTRCGPAPLGSVVVHDRLPAIRSAREPIPDEVRWRVYDRDGWACQQCGAGQPLSLDHIWPWSLGGADTEDNLQTLCIPCNSRKGARVTSAAGGY